MQWERFHGRWAALIYRPGPPKQTIRIAHFERAVDAAIAHDRVALYLNGPQAPRNFPRRALAPASIETIRLERRRAVKGRKTSRFNGVYSHRGRRGHPCWPAELRVSGRPLRLGNWPTERLAALAHDRALLYYGGGHELLNFPRQARVLEPAAAQTLRAESERLRKRATSSRFRGVTWVKRLGCWRARITVDSELRHLGLFVDEEEAARAYDAVAAAAFGARAKLNLGRTRRRGR